MNNNNKSYNNKRPVLDSFFRPANSLESKALYLEETLDNMISHADYLFKKIRINEKKGRDVAAIVEKRKSILAGINEVHLKCLKIWKDIQENDGS